MNDTNCIYNSVCCCYFSGQGTSSGQRFLMEIKFPGNNCPPDTMSILVMNDDCLLLIKIDEDIFAPHEIVQKKIKLEIKLKNNCIKISSSFPFNHEVPIRHRNSIY